MRRLKRALLIGNSDGIGLALTRRLLDQGWAVTGISRSPSPLSAEHYHHHVADILDRPRYRDALRRAWADEVDTVIYCAGIGESLQLDDLGFDTQVFDVNLTGAVIAISETVPHMVARGHGHFIGLSSQADSFINADAPSYSASKAGLSSYLHGLALALRKRGVALTHIRFGFVATKMAKAEIQPFIVDADRAARVVERCMRKRPIRYTFPKRMAALMWFLRWGPRLRLGS